MTKTLFYMMPIVLVCTALTSCCCEMDSYLDPCPRPCVPKPYSEKPCPPEPACDRSCTSCGC